MEEYLEDPIIQNNVQHIESAVDYSVEKNNIIYTDIYGQKHNFGSILDMDSIKKQKINKWWNSVIETINFDILKNFIVQIDSIVYNTSFENKFYDNTYIIHYNNLNSLFNNTYYSEKFNQPENRIIGNKTEFIKLCFQLNNLDLEKILNLKFPNSVIQYEMNEIKITML